MHCRPAGHARVIAWEWQWARLDKVAVRIGRDAVYRVQVQDVGRWRYRKIGVACIGHLGQSLIICAQICLISLVGRLAVQSNACIQSSFEYEDAEPGM